MVACTADPTQDTLPSAPEGETWVTLDFGDKSFDKIEITTRATLTPSAESRVSNIYVFLFDVSGKRVYGHYFDNSNRMSSETELRSSRADSWWVVGNSSRDDATHGKIRMYAPQLDGGTLYVISNIDADMMNISPEKLSFIQSLDDLKAMTASLNQELTERTGFFPMTGYADNIRIIPDHIYSNGSESFVVPLSRIDAKVEVKIRAAAGYEGSSTSADGTVTSHKIKEFVPLSWQVVNLPRTTYVLPHTLDAEGGYFDSDEGKFESRATATFSYTDAEGNSVETTSDEHGFSFYMLENRNEAKRSTGNDYHLRDRRIKNDDGTYDTTTNDLWEYAPEEATYLVIKGEVVMELDLSNEAKAQQLSADVVYYVHLGDFAHDCDDYDICRNSSYTYTITIKGVNNIQLEVETKTQENESGATGHVYVAKESIYTFDAHYGRAVFAFDEAHITDVEHLSWYVKTPFGREGSPNVIGGIEVPSGLDYQWVHFIINEHDEHGYNHEHEWFNPDKAMDILDFSKYIKRQKNLYLIDKANGTLDTPSSDFRPEYDSEWAAKFPDEPELHTRYRIYVTIFVDEFYYTANPLTGDVREDLWKDFVNQPNRIMHILCDADKSADGASTTTGSVVTIRQRSIQTIFNTENPELKTAWGCETIDETRDSLWFYSRKESYDTAGEWKKPSGVAGIPSNCGNNSRFNGLYNTAKIWGLTSGGTYTPKNWYEFIDFDQRYSLCDDDATETLRYACLTRNRDENGNGVIDASEIKWYIASINQLSALYIGDQGIHQDAALYPRYKSAITTNVMDDGNAYTWRAHIVSSTAGADKHPIILWAEEGLSTSSYSTAYGKSSRLSIRCVRNLGMDPTSEAEAEAMLLNENRQTEKAIQMSGPGMNGNTESVNQNSVYTFDMANMNPMSIRYYTSRELEPNDETSFEARVYWSFETGIMTDESYSYAQLYELVRDGKSPCPEGYRIPNIREGSLMSLNCPSAWDEHVDSRVSTYNSQGTMGLKLDMQGPSWYFSTERTCLDNTNEAKKIRCVRDVRQ